MIDYMLDDFPIEQDKPLWRGLYQFADQLAKMLPTFPTSSPVLLSGDWGAGKTTLLLALQRRLKINNVPTLWFDAWRYEGETALLPALIRTVWESAPDELHRSEEMKDFFRTAWRCAVAVGMRVAPVIATAAGVPLVSSMLTGWRTKHLDEDINAVAVSSSLEPPEDPTQGLWQSFSKLLERAWPNRNVIILVDDLDRCSPENAVSLLDGIRLLISGAEGKVRCHFVVALDRKILAEGVRKKFGGISGYDCNRYLEKIFPLSFDLPMPQNRDVSQLLETFLHVDGAGADDASVYDHRDALIAALSDPIFANPRLMKRCINRFHLLVRFENTASETKSKGQLEETSGNRTLAKWIAAAERWPRLRWVIRAHDELYWEQVSQSLKDPSQSLPDTDVEHLLHDEGAKSWLQREMLSQGRSRITEFQKAEARLQRWGL